MVNFSASGSVGSHWSPAPAPVLTEDINKAEHCAESDWEAIPIKRKVKARQMSFFIRVRVLVMKFFVC